MKKPHFGREFLIPKLSKSKLFETNPKLYFILTEKKLFSASVKDKVLLGLYSKLLNLFNIENDTSNLSIPKKCRFTILMASITFANFKISEGASDFEWNMEEFGPSQSTEFSVKKPSLKSNHMGIFRKKDKKNQHQTTAKENLTTRGMKSNITCLKHSFTMISKDKMERSDEKPKPVISTESSLVAESNAEGEPPLQSEPRRNGSSLQASFEKSNQILDSFDRFKKKIIDYISHEFESVYNLGFLKDLFTRTKNSVLGSFGESLFAQLLGETCCQCANFQISAGSMFFPFSRNCTQISCRSGFRGTPN